MGIRTHPKVHYFGTCRIHAPLKMLSEDGDINLLDNSWSFLHTSREIIQAIEIAKGATVDSQQAGVLAGFPRYCPDANSSMVDLTEADVFFVEVSSLKLFSRNANYIQLNRLREATVVKHPELEIWFRSLEKTGKGMLPKNRTFEDYRELAGLLEEATCVAIDSDSLSLDLHRICDSLPAKICMMNCFNYPRSDGNGYLPSRELIEQVIENFEHPNLIGKINPTRLLEQHGFIENTKDSAHYEEWFVPKVTACLKAQISKWGM